MMIKLLFADGTTWEDQNARRVRVNLHTGTMLIRGAHSDSGPDDVQVKRIDLRQLLSITVDRNDNQREAKPARPADRVTKLAQEYWDEEASRAEEACRAEKDRA